MSRRKGRPQALFHIVKGRLLRFYILEARLDEKGGNWSLWQNETNEEVEGP